MRSKSSTMFVVISAVVAWWLTRPPRWVHRLAQKML